MQTTVASSASRFFFALVVKLLLFVGVGVGDAGTWFLVAEPGLFQQAPAARLGVLDAVAVSEILLDQRGRPRRCVDPDLRGWLLDSLFDLFLLCF